MVGVDVFTYNVSDIFNSVHIVDTLVFLMVFYTALGLADGTRTSTSDTGADLYTFTVVEFANGGYFFLLCHGDVYNLPF